MINPLFLPQNSKSNKKRTQTQNIQKINLKKQYKLIHQLDCIYQGQINQSYQRDGFGIQQTNDFQMYIGFWKSNKPNGIGIIIYPQGGLIYGNFKDGQLHGVAITDNKKKLRLGIFNNLQIVGTGFEYIYDQNLWKLSKFHKGVSIQTVAKIEAPLQNEIPSLINLHQDMYMILFKYLNEQFFDISYKNLIEKPYRPYNQMNVHKISNSYIFFGQIIEGKYWGLGCIFDKKKGYSIETGYYETGQLNGYGLRIDQQKNAIYLGLYNKGKKQGFFYQRSNRLQIVVEYQKNFMRGQHPQLNIQKIKNNQKIFNYQKNDFYSQRNKIKFNQFWKIFKPNQKQNEYQAFKFNIHASKNKLQLQKQLKKSKQKHSPNVIDKKLQTMSPKGSINLKYMVSESTNVTSVQMIRQKLGDIDRLIQRSKAMMKQQKSKSNKKSSNQKVLFDLDRNEKVKNSITSDGEIGDQQVPVQKNILAYSSRFKKYANYGQKRNISKQKEDIIKDSINEDENKRNYLSPQAVRKIWSPDKSQKKFLNRRQSRIQNSQNRQLFQRSKKSRQNGQQKQRSYDDFQRQSVGVSRRKKRRIFQ